MKGFIFATVICWSVSFYAFSLPDANEKTTVIRSSFIDIPNCERIQTRFKNESVIHHFNCQGKSVKVIEKITAIRI